ncbi:hypothetical protein ACI68E_000936 [Malassezia pachydermatis]
MPYKERPRTPTAEEERAKKKADLPPPRKAPSPTEESPDDDDDDDDEIVMPAGPPPPQAHLRQRKTPSHTTSQASTIAAPVRYDTPPPAPTESAWDPSNEPVFDPDNDANNTAPGVTEPASLSAAPQLRDFQKETTIFVPMSVRRRREPPRSSQRDST